MITKIKTCKTTRNIAIINPPIPLVFKNKVIAEIESIICIELSNKKITLLL